jgi:uncharacterized membrane protein
MELVLVAGIVLTGTGVIVGLFLPFLTGQLARPEKIRLYAIIGAVLIVLGTVCEVFAIWPLADLEAAHLDRQ